MDLSTDKRIGALLARLRVPALAFGFGGGGLILLVAAILDWGLARDVQLIAPRDPVSVEVHRGLFALDPTGMSVMEIYGAPYGSALAPIRVVWPRTDRLIQPPEDPRLLLLKVDKQAGENPLQTRTVWLLARFTAAPLIALGMAGLLCPRRGRGSA